MPPSLPLTRFKLPASTTGQNRRRASTQANRLHGATHESSHTAHTLPPSPKRWSSHEPAGPTRPLCWDPPHHHGPLPRPTTTAHYRGPLPRGPGLVV
ncbi:uncharacterized protein EKO05_0007216 [Ascochyta rabiei]|uniref:uncharacterized protein n=1 Tax=Didymella rabiei TaxID=5454 RepID=UPI0021FAABDD|nr:uncharacterized protein EKO05_0007216 [Ascochyta rabiei]UPX16833.1 hypothetical protein EKO05_0007216 [Ascochyta rabiei]